MLENRLPASQGLDSNSFQQVMNAPHRPLVVIVATSKDQMETIAGNVQAIAKQWKDIKGDPRVSFAWMDADKWANWLSSMYGIKGNTLPRVVIANHSVRHPVLHCGVFVCHLTWISFSASCITTQISLVRRSNLRQTASFQLSMGL